MSGEYRFGIEEEYFINDAVKRDAARARMQEFFAQAREHLSRDIHREMLEPQVEIATTPSFDFADAHRQLKGMRSGLGAIAEELDLSIMASGTHPLAVWSRVRATNQPRYGKVMHDLQMIGSRLVLSPM